MVRAFFMLAYASDLPYMTHMYMVAIVFYFFGGATAMIVHKVYIWRLAYVAPKKGYAVVCRNLNDVGDIVVSAPSVCYAVRLTTLGPEPLDAKELSLLGSGYENRLRGKRCRHGDT